MAVKYPQCFGDGFSGMSNWPLSTLAVGAACRTRGIHPKGWKFRSGDDSVDRVASLRLVGLAPDALLWPLGDAVPPLLLTSPSANRESEAPNVACCPERRTKGAAGQQPVP
jgi:hypothetical protein